MASVYCAPRAVFPKVISGLRRPIAIQAAISFNKELAGVTTIIRQVIGKLDADSLPLLS